MIIVTNAKKQLLLQEVKNELEANHISLMTGKDVALDKLTIPQLTRFLDSLGDYLKKIGK